MSTAWHNGSFVEEDAASVSIRDTGLLHAAGVFTTMRAYAGRTFRLGQHLARIRSSCQALSIPLQYTDADLAGAVDELVRANALADARLRLTITRGSARLDPAHGPVMTPTCFVTATPLEPYPQEFYDRGMTVVVIDDQKLNPYDLQAGHKTLNYLSRLAALRSANQRSAGEALWFNVHNYLQSGSISNVFIVKGGKVLTPPTPDEMQGNAELRQRMAYPRSAVLPGVTRGAVLELAQANNIPAEMGAIDVSQLLAADEVFITNSIMGVMPVCRIERKAIGNDKPGPVTTRLATAYEGLVRAELG